MENQEDNFRLIWSDKFPGVEPPCIQFDEIADAEQKLDDCKSAIRTLEEKLSQEKFYLIFLQTYLAAKKKAYSSGRWGYGKKAPTDSEKTAETETKNGEHLNAETEAPPMDGDVNPVHLEVKTPEPLSIKDKRRSKVLENVKMFEARSDAMESDGSALKATARKRTSYLEMWECKTGPDKESLPTMSDSTPNLKFAFKSEQSSVESLDEAAINMASGSKIKVPRSDYVEVWRCNTGDQISVGVVYDDQDDFVDDMHPGDDYDIGDIDMRDGYGKRHYTMAGSDVKLRNPIDDGRNKKRLTWPIKVPEYEDDDTNMDDHFSSNIDLSDFDNDDDDGEDTESTRSSRRGSLDSSSDPSVRNPSSNSSPLHELRQVRTTDERVGCMWLDNTSVLSDRTSVLSLQSVEIQSSDDDILTADDTVSVQSVGATTSIPVNRSRSNGVKLDGETDATPKRQGTKIQRSTALTSSLKTEAVSDMVDYQKVRSIAEAEKLRMRRWVLTSLLENEGSYLQYLNTLLQYMKPLRATIGTSQPVMSAQDFDTLFFRVPELFDLHSTFFHSLKPRLDDWTADTSVGDLFKKLLSKLNFYGDYVNNYKRAQQTVEKCARENKQFSDIISKLKVQPQNLVKETAESITLIQVLYKPVERVMRNTLVLQDLLKHTPHRHPDYQLLRQVLKQSQHFLERINSTSSYKPRRVPSSVAAAARSADRELIKDGLLVEVSNDGTRKLRHCFLYNDLLLCAKQKNAAGVFNSKVTYECKWYIPLADLNFQPQVDSDATPEYPATTDDELRDMSARAQQAKLDIAKERKRSNKHRAKQEQGGKEIAPVRTRREERLRKKLAELESRIVLMAPSLPLKLYKTDGKSYVFLMSSDYERVEWCEAIAKQQESCFKSFTLASLEISALLAGCVRQRKVDTIGLMLSKEDDQLLSGFLDVTIHSGSGFLHKCQPYCSLEVDSYGQFQTKAKTRPCTDTKEPQWDEQFELEVDGAQTLRILCYDKARNFTDDVLIAKGKVGLVQDSLRKQGCEWKRVSVLMNEIEIRVSIHFVPRERSLQRLPSKMSTGVFGVKIELTGKRDSSGIPSIVRKCVSEVERRGMDEVGIYRVSGVASEIQALKASFDANRKDVTKLLTEVDINAVAGVLKLYFRELPEPLFTNSRYTNFVEASSLVDPDTKRRTFVQLLSDLPPVNYQTLYFLRNHLIKVSQNDLSNKMNLHNLATVFGPTLLRPAEERGSTTDMNMLNALRLDVHYQMDALLYCLELKDLPSYESLNSSKASDESAADSSAAATSSSSDTAVKRDVTGDTLVPAPLLMPPQQRRQHMYEEISFDGGMSPRSLEPPPVIPPVPKPKPAPRKIAAASAKPIVTDL